MYFLLGAINMLNLLAFKSDGLLIGVTLKKILLFTDTAEKMKRHQEKQIPILQVKGKMERRQEKQVLICLKRKLERHQEKQVLILQVNVMMKRHLKKQNQR